MVTTEIPAGLHTVVWRYAKGASSPLGEDRGQVDEVTFSGKGGGSGTIFSSWKTENFTPAEVAAGNQTGPMADPDGDRVPNLLEAVLGTLPRTPDFAEPPLLLIDTLKSGSSRATLLSAKRAAVEISDASIQLQSSASVTGPWVVIAQKSGSGKWIGTSGTTASESPAIAGRIKVSFFHSNSSPDRRFYRMAATLAP